VVPGPADGTVVPRASGRRPSARDRIGDALVTGGRVSADQLDWALDVQRRTGSRLGAILLAAGLVSRQDLYQILAEQWGVPFVDVTTVPLDLSLGEGLDVSLLAGERWVPIGRRPDGAVVVATAQQPTAERVAAIGRVLGRRAVALATTDWDVDYALRTLFKEQLLDEASHGLWRKDNDRSARAVLTRRQRVAFVLCLGALVGGLVVTPRLTVAVCSAVVAVAFLVSVGFKFVVCLVGAYHEAFVEVTDEEVAALDETELPVYTVLVPCYHEANVVPNLMANLAALDYPPEKLDVLLLLEEDDHETRAAAVASRPPATVTFVTVPRGDPQTKPKACNVGLVFARGEYLVIYDAEDRPDPDQLKRSIAAFRKGGPDLVCVQAALNYFNAEENALTRMFTLEYSFWFDYMLTGLTALRLPVPLGGTSNHFRTDELRLLGGWDPFNVTEDADLGIRAAVLGKRVGVVNSTTFEEANNAYRNFVRQRSRWVKGYLQTTLVHLRHPVELVRSVGWRQAVGFALLIGGTPASFLTMPPLYLLLAVSLALPPSAMAWAFPGWILWVSLANFLLGNALMVYVSMMGVFKRRRHRLVLWALLNPLYWLLHAVAAYKALAQLVLRPHYWEKTAHGLTAVQPSAGPR
jgi:cellulose synthase/poly-beta-1,6-N-acetylglucosamine synthase-like glycosyltransferase